MKQKSSHAHPLIKALIIAMNGLEKNKERVMAISTDHDSTYNSEETMRFIVIMEKKESDYQILNITSIDNKDYNYDESILEKIVRTEKIIERIDDKDIPIDIFIESLSNIGIRAKVIKEHELDDALIHAKMIINSKRVVKNLYFNQKSIDKINSITDSSQLENTDPIIRSIITSFYGMFKYPQYQIHIYPSKKIEKYKARKIIHDYLLNNRYMRSA